MEKRKNAVRKRGKKDKSHFSTWDWRVVTCCSTILKGVTWCWMMWKRTRQHQLWETLQCWIRCEVQLWSIVIGRSEAQAETLVEDKRNNTLSVLWHLPTGVSSPTTHRLNTLHRKPQGLSDIYPDPQNSQHFPPAQVCFSKISDINYSKVLFLTFSKQMFVELPCCTAGTTSPFCIFCLHFPIWLLHSHITKQ